MLLMSSALAFRGDNARNILWSDLFSADVPMDDIGLGVHVKVSTMVSPHLDCLQLTFCCRLLRFSLTMQNTIRRGVLMRQALSVTAL